MHDEELASGTVRHHGTSHGKNTGGMFQIIFETILIELSFDGIAGTAHTGSVRASALDHETFDHAMEDQTIIVAFLYQTDEVVDGVRSNLRIQLCFDDAAIFHFGSVSLTADPSRTATLEAARYARQQGKLVSFDPNYRPLLWEHPADAVVQMQEGVKLADLLKVSEEEMQLITNESDLARGSQALLEMGPSLVLVSLGAKGAYYRNAVGAGHLPTYDVPTVDTTGAGDAFMGAIHYQLRGKDAEDLRTLPAFELEEIVRFGNAAGSLTTTKGGAIPAMPSMVEIQNCIASIPLL